MVYVHIYVLYIYVLGGITLSKIPYIHYYQDKQNLIHHFYLALFPLLLFGFYKNGIRLYVNELISFSDLFIPLYFYFISGIIGFAIALIRKENKKEYILYSLILASTISINTNLFIYPVLLFVSLFIGSYLKDRFKFNFIALTHLLLLLALFLHSYSYLNVADKLDVFHYNLLDVFVGFGIGGIASSSFLLTILAFVILSFSRFYKKIIPLMASISFFLPLLGIFFITKDTTYIEIILNGSPYFAFVFIGAHLSITPDTHFGMMIYGIIIGILSALFSLFVPFSEVAFISIFLVSLFLPLIHQFENKKYLQE